MHTNTIMVTGMRCGGCTSKLSAALYASTGVADVQISLASGEVIVRYEERVTLPTRLNAVVVKSGFGVDGATATNGHDPRSNGCG